MKNRFRSFRKIINNLFSYFRPSPPLPIPMKDVINKNFEKIQDEIEKLKFTLDILLQHLQDHEKEIHNINKKLESINDWIQQTIRNRDRSPD